MIISLPEELEEAIAAALRGRPSAQWIASGQRLSAAYRGERGPGDERLVRGEVAALGYAALILPAAYGQLWGAMAALRARIPAWQPRTLLDVGSGPGTALWAAVDHWPGLQSCTAWEREPAFMALGKQFAAAGPHPALTGARWEHVNLGGSLDRSATQYDLIVLGHVLNELEPKVQDGVVDWAWAACAGVLLIVEPGTTAAFAVVRRLRELLIGKGAHTLAPCVHDRPCPLQNDWCHFPQRIERPAFQRRAKEAQAGWEDSKFSYAVMSRFPPPAPLWGRLIHQPHPDRAGVTLTVSAQEGIIRPRIPKREKAAYRAATDLRWGEALAGPPDGVELR